MSRRMKGATMAALTMLAVASNASSQNSLTAKGNGTSAAMRAVAKTDRARDGLIGPVRRVRTEVVKLTNAGGRFIEGKRTPIEITAYDAKGKKIENEYFPLAGVTLTGKEVYKYDDKGNIREMVLLNEDGSVLGKEVYNYEFDFAGNWNKMTTSVAVEEGGRIALKPTEVTYRSIMYYLDARMLKMVQPASRPAGSDSRASAPLSANSPVAKSSQAPPVAPTVNETNTNGLLEVNLPLTTAQPELEKKPIVADPAPDKTESIGTNVAQTTSSVPQTPSIVLDLEPPPSAEPKPLNHPISKGVLNGTALSLPVPQYPEIAKRRSLSGTVPVEVVVDETGKVISARATGGPVPLREAAVQAALKARFSATKLSGEPVKVLGVIYYKFALDRVVNETAQH